MIQLRRLLSVCCASLALCGCSEDPTAAMERILRVRVAQQSVGYLNLSKFTKRDAVRGQENGVEFYHVTYSVEVQGMRNGGFLNICSGHDKYSPLQSFFVRETPNRWDCFTMPVEMGHVYVMADNRLNREATLAKHESGWVLSQQ